MSASSPADIPAGPSTGEVVIGTEAGDIDFGDIDVAGIEFVKGHGTENDFILLPDPTGTLEVSAAQVRALCDRHAGIGGDGVIRVAPAPAGGDAPFVMDYRNADGSLAEMCGNGARLFARYLVDAGWAEAGAVTFQTRGGMRTAQVPTTGDVTVEMGPVRLGRPSSTTVSGREIHGVAVNVGNPHLVCLTDLERSKIDLCRQPAFDEAVFPDGVNIEFVTVLGPGSVQMRV
ncbi:MAG: diaminopimelate epimerase, partial [Nakamurella sp.]